MGVFSPQGQKVELILNRMIERVKNGKIDRDYTIAKRENYKILKANYYIDERKIKEILISLTVDDYVTSGNNEDEYHSEDFVHIFKKTTKLLPRYSDDYKLVNVELYIKFTWIDDRFLYFISFHESRNH